LRNAGDFNLVKTRDGLSFFDSFFGQAKKGQKKHRRKNLVFKKISNIFLNLSMLSFATYFWEDYHTTMLTNLTQGQCS
jgi:hypothetical protein